MGRRVIAIAAAVLLAIVGVTAVVMYANGADQRAVAGAQPRAVFISAQAVPAGTTLNDAVANGLIVQTSLPAKSVPIGVLTAITDDNKNLLALSEISPGEYIQSARFGTTPVGNQAIRVPSGQIAVSLTLSDPARVGSFVAPGSHIVLYDTIASTAATTAAPAQAGAGTQTHVLFDDVLVIAIGSTALTPARPAGEATANAANQQGTLVTLALTPEQAPRLVHALQSGNLYAGLRGSDVKIDGALVVSDGNVFNR